MIKWRPANLLVFFFLAYFISFITPSRQSAHLAPAPCRIDRISPQNHSLAINCAVLSQAGKFDLRFADQFAGVDRLSDRVYGLKIRDEHDAILQLEIRGEGFYRFDVKSPQRLSIDYEMRLARAYNPSQFALVSSLGNEAGFLMLGDLLPRLCADHLSDADCDTLLKRTRLTIESPPNWRIATTETSAANNFEISDPRHAVFFLGRLREKTAGIGAINLRMAIAGAWGFTDQDVFNLAETIAKEQSAMIGAASPADSLITLAPFPQPLMGLRSSAITQGRSSVVMLNPNNDAQATFDHYRRHLAHEMFHFYLPNSFRVRENFDWFWEGAARYIALVTLARLKLINLQDYLDAIGSEYEAYWFNPLRNQVSLITASPEKFSSASNYDLIYRKGMLVAALYDLELRWQSRGKLSLSDVMRSLYQKYSNGKIEIGNREVLDEMRAAGDFARQLRDDVESVRDIELNQRIDRYGLVMDWTTTGRGKARLKAATKLSTRQQTFLSELMKHPGQ